MIKKIKQTKDVPVQSLIDEMNLKIAVEGIAVLIVVSILRNIVWKRRLKHYNSASS